MGKKRSKNYNSIKKTSNSSEVVKNDPKGSVINNGLSEAIFGTSNPFISNQISESDTMFKNLRWYLISNFRQLLSQAYVEFGIVRTIVDVPVDDALRGGVDIKTKQLDEEQISALVAEMEEEGDFNILAQAMKWNRLYGGAGIIVATDQKAEREFNWDLVDDKTPLSFKSADMWELYSDKQNMTQEDREVEVTDENFKLDETEVFNYYAKKIHSSRVMKLVGQVAPSFLRPRLRGWGMSVVESIVRSINQYLKATDLTFEVLDEFKIDIYKIKGLAEALITVDGTAKINRRIQTANLQKNYQNAVTMDSEDDFSQKQLVFTGIAETMAGIRQQLASDLRIPMTKLFGMSSAGFNSGEDDIENYNSMVESEIRPKAKYHLIKMIKIRSKKMFGIVPDDLSVEFKPLRIMSSEQEESVKDRKFLRALQAKQSGELTPEEFRDIVNRENLLGTKLEVNKTIFEELSEQRSVTGEQTLFSRNDIKGF